MLALGWIAAGAGLLGRATARLAPRGEVWVLAAYGWGAAFVYGAIMNLWSWPFLQGDGPTLWKPGLGFAATLDHYWSYYVATSFAWDAAGALANVVLVLMTGVPLLRALRRNAHRLDPVVEFAV
jgi:energy-coupling factor transport system substrate-specific component